MTPDHLLGQGSVSSVQSPLSFSCNGNLQNHRDNPEEDFKQQNAVKRRSKSKELNLIICACDHKQTCRGFVNKPFWKQENVSEIKEEWQATFKSFIRYSFLLKIDLKVSKIGISTAILTQKIHRFWPLESLIHLPKQGKISQQYTTSKLSEVCRY